MVRIDGISVNGASARYSGRMLTLTLTDSGMPFAQIAQMLGGDPVIEVIRSGAVTAVYRGVTLHALTMETTRGVLEVTASLSVGSVSGGGQEQTASTALALAQAAADAVKAIEEGMTGV